MQGSHMPPALSNRSLIVGLPLQQCSKCFSSSSVLVSRQAVQLPLLHHRCPCLTAHGCLSAPFQPACFQLSATVRSCAARCALMLSRLNLGCRVLFLVALAACALWYRRRPANRCNFVRSLRARASCSSASEAAAVPPERLLHQVTVTRRKLEPVDVLSCFSLVVPAQCLHPEAIGPVYHQLTKLCHLRICFGSVTLFGDLGLW